MRSFPWPPLPTGWFVVAFASELTADGPLPLRYFGRDLVLFRGRDGAPALLDAHCAHLGTHLGIGGTLDEGRVRCPMHGYAYDSAGVCAEAGLRVGSWRVQEVTGLIWAHHGQGEPGWQPPRIAEHADPSWTPFVEGGNRWTVRTQVQAAQENVVDARHLRWLHGARSPALGLLKEDGPVLSTVLSHVWNDDGLVIETAIDLFGLGLSVQHTSIGGAPPMSVLLTITTPIDAERIDLRVACAVPRRAGRDDDALVRPSVDSTRTAFEQDIRVWESRDYSVRRFGPGDGPLRTFHTWAEQFNP
ncbi:aromatic ring-hydroxylating oxygenase subunit alpha [Spirillospora sp. CA-253888]